LNFFFGKRGLKVVLGGCDQKLFRRGQAGQEYIGM
jgi:hypothetical protein